MQVMLWCPADLRTCEYCGDEACVGTHLPQVTGAWGHPSRPYSERPCFTWGKTPFYPLGDEAGPAWGGVVGIGGSATTAGHNPSRK